MASEKEHMDRAKLGQMDEGTPIRPLPGTEGTRYLPTGWEWWSWESFSIGMCIGMGIGALLIVIGGIWS